MKNSDPIETNFQVIYFDQRNSLGVAMNLLSFGYLQIRRINLITEFVDLKALVESGKNGAMPNFDLAAKFSIDQLMNAIRITICFENFMKGLLLLNGYMINRLRRKVFKELADNQYQEPIPISTALNGRKWEPNNEIVTSDPNLKLQITGILKTTIGMKELKQPKYQAVFKIDEKVLEICEPYFEYRNNLHLYLGEQFSFSESTTEDIRILVKFINDHVVRIHNLIINEIDKGEEYKLSPIILNE